MTIIKEICPSNKTVCCQCRKELRKGELRVKEETGHSSYGGHPFYSYYCADDGLKRIREIVGELSELHRDLKREYEIMKAKNNG